MGHRRRALGTKPKGSKFSPFEQHRHHFYLLNFHGVFFSSDRRDPVQCDSGEGERHTGREGHVP